MDQDEQQQRKNLLATHRRNLAHFETQAAQYGKLNIPVHLNNQIMQEREAIAQLEGGTGPSELVYGQPPVPSTPRFLEHRETQPSLDTLFMDAYTIDIVGMSLAGIATQHVELLCQKAHQGCAIRLLLLNPEISGLMFTASSFLSRETPEGQASEIRTSLQRLTTDPQFVQTAQIRLCNYPLAHGILIINGHAPEARMRVELYLHRQRPNRTPGFWLHRRDDEWFEVFYKEFNVLWSGANPYVPQTITNPKP